ncbi:MAG: DPP IV N-terminal domain-containing protein [Chitinophagales bacterium]
MYKRKISLLLGVLIISTYSFAQKKQFTIAEATNGMATTLAPKSIKNASWQPGTGNFWQTEKENGQDVWRSIDFATKDGANTSVIAQGKYQGKVAVIPAIKWLDKDNAYFVNGKDVILGTLSGHEFSWATWTILPEQAENITVDKNRKIAYTLDNNLWLYDKEKIQVTAEANKDIVCGKSVHREEFGIDKGIFFSPKGNYVAYYRMDQTMVKDYPIIKWDTVPARSENIKYPMAGGTSHEVTLCVFDPATRKTVVMKTGTPNKDHYLTAVTWSPDGKNIYIAILNRDQNHLWLNQYNAETGEKIKTLFEETNPKYVHPTHSLTFIPGKDNEFIWWSERDGYEHLYLYNTDGRLIRKLTSGKWVVNEIAGTNASDKKLIITASKESPIEKHIYSVSIDNGNIARIDKGAGMHNALCSEDGKYVLDVYSGAGIPKTSSIYATDGSFSKELIKAADPLAGYDRPQIRNVIIKAADGVTPLYGKLILPTNFDSTKKYPVIVYLYNGPNVQLIHNSFPESGNLWYEYMAQHGYIVFTMDGRGSWNRGLDFEQATFRRLGDVEMKDQLKGVDYLKSLSYVDAGRMGIHGWSYGGFMTTSLMLKHPGVFKCAVAGGPVMDWKMYEVMYTERYMDTPEDNPEGYENANLLDKVKNLKGKLLLIHGTNDNTVVWQHSINFLKKCVDENVQVDYFVYPGYEHNVRGKDRVHLMQKISDYFDEYLKP